MPGAFVWVQTIAAVVTTLAAVGVFAFVRRIYSTIREHDRVLFGEEAVTGWDGIVPLVKENQERSQRNKEYVDELRDECLAD